MSDPSLASRQGQRAHADPVAQVLQAIGSKPEGLTAGEAALRLAEYGPNRLPAPPKDGLVKRFLRHFHDVLIYILLVAAGVTAALGEWIDTGVILGVVLVNTIIGFIQEGKAEQALESIRKLLSVQAHVRRDGRWVELDAEELVPGDIVRLRSGDRVPADVRLIETVGLLVEESALTGESVAAEKDPAPVAEDAGVGDRASMVYAGTMVAGGRGLGVVTATASETELGRINAMIADVETLDTPLTRQMSQFGRILAVVVVGMTALLILVGRLLHDQDLSELFLAGIGFAVAAIPEGLPAILTITLARGVQIMAQRKAITRRLDAVETLGSVTVICSDKTGTLTANEMTVRHVVTANADYEVSGTGYAPKGEVTRNGQRVRALDHSDLFTLVEVMAVANDAHLSQEAGNWRVVGEPTEGALRVLAAKAEFQSDGYERLSVIPFDSTNKYMATLDRTPPGDVRILFKGAPDRLLERCRQQGDSHEAPDRLDRDRWHHRIDALSGQGLRVLAAASRSAPPGATDLKLEDLDDGFVFHGIVGIVDPPRPEALTAIQDCQQAGIRVKMVTGDHAGTASAIGREMGIGLGAAAVTGQELEATSDDDLRAIARERDVFARTSPEHKLRLVMALQANGEVTAMTGDGVNDAPALKRADVGVAMGIKGTEATKEAAEIVLADDNFASIARAVEAGRTIYDNLRKAIAFVLPTNVAQSLVILVAVLLGWVLPLTPVQVLWVNMIVAVTLALALAFEPSEQDVMRRPPRDPQEAILTPFLVWRLALVSVLIAGATTALFWIRLSQGVELEVARTVALNTLVYAQAFYLFNSRFLRESSLHLSTLFTNPVAWLSVGVLTVLQVAFVYAPFMQTWFGSRPLQPRDWGISLGIGLALFLLIEGEKAVVRRFAARGQRVG